MFSVIKEGKAAGPDETLAAAKAAGAVTMNWGVFINTVVNFVIVAFAVFLIVKGVNKARRKQEALPAEPTTRECPYCLSVIPVKATRCAHCTSELKAA